MTPEEMHRQAMARIEHLRCGDDVETFMRDAVDAALAVSRQRIVFKSPRAGQFLIGLEGAERLFSCPLPAMSAAWMALSFGRTALAAFVDHEHRAPDDAVRVSLHGACVRFAESVAHCRPLAAALLCIRVTKDAVIYEPRPGAPSFITGLEVNPAADVFSMSVGVRNRL